LALLSSPGRGRSGAARRPQVAERFGGALDILVNNVGRNIRKATTEYSAEEYRAVMATNLDSTYRMCQVCPMPNPTLNPRPGMGPEGCKPRADPGMRPSPRRGARAAGAPAPAAQPARPRQHCDDGLRGGRAHEPEERLRVRHDQGCARPCCATARTRAGG